MAPARLSIATTASSSDATLSANSTLPKLVGSPLASIRSLTPSGSPCSGPRLSPRITAASLSRAVARPVSNERAMTALTAGSMSSIRRMQLSMSSTGESLRSPISARAVTAGRSHGSVMSGLLFLDPALAGQFLHLGRFLGDESRPVRIALEAGFVPDLLEAFDHRRAGDRLFQHRGQPVANGRRNSLGRHYRTPGDEVDIGIAEFGKRRNVGKELRALGGEHCQRANRAGFDLRPDPDHRIHMV